jgi:hypothetical protein
LLVDTNALTISKLLVSSQASAKQLSKKKMSVVDRLERADYQQTITLTLKQLSSNGKFEEQKFSHQHLVFKPMSMVIEKYD